MTIHALFQDNSFEGFPKEGVEFLKQLKENNNRDWFNVHKSDYLDYIKTPSEHFFAVMKERVAELIDQPCDGKLYRIYRDIRFSKNKTPYKTHIHMSFFPKGKTKYVCGDRPAFHFGLEPDVMYIGVGNFAFSSEVLERYRQSILHDFLGQQLEDMIEGYLQNDKFALEKPALKRIPHHYDKEHERAWLLRYKGLRLWHNQPLSENLFTGEIVEMVKGKMQQLLPLYHWIDRLS